jgi:hypothetical protein
MFTDRGSGVAQYIALTNLDATGSLTTVLSLTGKFMINLLYADGFTASDIDQWKLTIDGVVVNDSDAMTTASTTFRMYGNSIDGDQGIAFMCDSSLLLEIEMTADTTINVYYIARPIL